MTTRSLPLALSAVALAAAALWWPMRLAALHLGWAAPPTGALPATLLPNGKGCALLACTRVWRPPSRVSLSSN